MSGIVKIEETIQERKEKYAPYSFKYGSAVVHDNQIFIFGGEDYENTYCYAEANDDYPITDWSNFGGDTTPNNLLITGRVGKAIEYRESLIILGGFDEYYNVTDESYKFERNGASNWRYWKQLPYTFDSGAAVVYNDRIHILGGMTGEYSIYYNHYSIGFGEDEWTNEGILPYPFGYGCAVVYDGAIHLLGGGPQKRAHYWWKNESDYGGEDDELPIDISNECDALVYGNKIHIFGEDENPSTKHYSWDGVQWIEEDPLPYHFFEGSAVVYHNRIHIIGGRYPSSQDPEWERYENHYALGYEYSNISKIQRGWLPVATNNIIEYVKTSDTDFNPKKVYYKLVDDEYVRVNPETEEWSSDYYEYHPIKTYITKTIRGAWTKYNGQIKKVLEAVPLVYRGKLSIPYIYIDTISQDMVNIGVLRSNDTFYLVYNKPRGYDGKTPDIKYQFSSYKLINEEQNIWEAESTSYTQADWGITSLKSSGIVLKAGTSFFGYWGNDKYFRIAQYSPLTYSFNFITPDAYDFNGNRIESPVFNPNRCYGIATLGSYTYVFGGIGTYTPSRVWRNRGSGSRSFDPILVNAPYQNEYQTNNKYYFADTYENKIHLIGRGNDIQESKYYTFDGTTFQLKNETVPVGFRTAGIRNGIIYILCNISGTDYYNMYYYDEPNNKWILRDEQLYFNGGAPISMQLVGNNFHIFAVKVTSYENKTAEVYRYITNLDNVFN